MFVYMCIRVLCVFLWQGSGDSWYRFQELKSIRGDIVSRENFQLKVTSKLGLSLKLLSKKVVKLLQRWHDDSGILERAECG